MIWVDDRSDARVLVVVPTGGLARFVQFENSLQGLAAPRGSDMYRTMSGSPAKGRGTAVRGADESFTHFFFVDDDHWFEGDVVMRLLARRLPIVCALTEQRMPPFSPMVYSGENVEPDGSKRLIAYSWAQLDGVSGVRPVFAAAGAGLLVERSVFLAIPEPWFAVGRFNAEELSEDFYFYERAREHGYTPHVDFDVDLMHIAPVAVRAVKGKDGVWVFALVWENGRTFVMGRSDVHGGIDAEQFA